MELSQSGRGLFPDAITESIIIVISYNDNVHYIPQMMLLATFYPQNEFDDETLIMVIN